MGPPLKAAENCLSAGGEARGRRSFNGAAAKSSGKCNYLTGERVTLHSFNGAAAKSSGKFSSVWDRRGDDLRLQWGRR